MTKLEEMLKTLADNAPTLRAAGVRSFSTGPGGILTAELAPIEAPLVPADVTEDEPQYRDPLDDPKTYGGTRAPGFERPDDDTDR